MNPSLIPLIAANQQLSISLAGVTYILQVTWNAFAGAWVLNINNSAGSPIITGLAMVTGADLLVGQEYLGFGFSLLVQTTNSANAVPTLANLGTLGNLYAVTA